MTPYTVLVIGPAGPERTGLETLLSDLGVAASGATFDEGARAAGPGHDLVVLLDRREPAAASRTLDALRLPAATPVLVLAGGLGRLLTALACGSSSRPAPGTWTAPPRGLPDADLARLAAAGSVPAFEALYARFNEPLLRYCRAIVRRPQEAEEAVQSALLNAYQALRSGRLDIGALHVKPWLFRIAQNQCLDALRRRRDTEELGETEPARGDGPPQLVSRRAEVRAVVDDLAKLDEPTRSALVLRELGGLSHVEIAESLQTTPARVKSLILQAREALAAFEAGRELPCAQIRARIQGADGRVLRSRQVTAHLRCCAACADHRTEVVERRGVMPGAGRPALAGPRAA